jgi:hypothetical protein
MKIQLILKLCLFLYCHVSISQSENTKQEYVDGRLIKTINKNGISVSTTLRSTKNQFGKYYFFDVSVSNGSNNTVTFKVNDCKATNIKISKRSYTKTKREDLQIMQNKEFQKIISRKQGWQSFFGSLSSSSKAKAAGEVTSNREVSFTNNNTFSNESTLRTTQEDNYGFITYLAQENEERKLQEFRKQQHNVKSKWNEKYIKSNTLSPLEYCSGILNVVYEDGDYMELLIKVDSLDFNFEWSSEDSEF